MKSRGRIISFVREYLDSLLAFHGVVLSVGLTFFLWIKMGQLVYPVIGILCLLVCTFYLVLSLRHKLPSVTTVFSLKTNPSTVRLLDVLFFALFIYSIWSFVLRPELYVRPIEYFISMAVLGALLGIKMLFLPSKGSPVLLTLVQIILVALSLEWTVLFLFPDLMGADPRNHQLLVLDILGRGSIKGSYQHLPIMHLAVGTTILITNLTYKMATIFSVTLLHIVCDVVFVFLIGRLVVNAKVGLLAALLAGTACWHIFFGYWTIPNTLGTTFVVATTYLILKIHKGKVRLLVLPCGLLMAALALTHAIAASWLVIILVVLWISLVIHKKLFKERVAISSVFTITGVFTAGLFSWWAFGSSHLQLLFHLLRNRLSPSMGLTTAPAVTTPPVVTPPLEPMSVPSVAVPASWESLTGAPLEFLFNSSGMFLFFAFSFIGCLYLLSRRLKTPYTSFVVVTGVLILSIGFFPMLLGMSVVEHRWWSMAQVILAIPLAAAIYLLSGLSRQKILRVCSVAVLVFLLVFLSTLGLPANQTNRTFSKNQIVCFGFTLSEVKMLQTISTKCEGTVGMDPWYRSTRLIPEVLTCGLGGTGLDTKVADFPPGEGRLKTLGPSLLKKDFSNCTYQILLIRDEIVNHPMGWGQGAYYKLDYDPREELTEQGFSKVYTCGSVGGFTK